MNVRSLLVSPILPLTAVLLWLGGCSIDAPSDGSGEEAAPRPNPYAQVVTPAERAELTNIYCGACHNVAGRSHEQIIAPPFVAIRQRYSRQYPDKEAFVAAVVDFTRNASKEKAIMRGPVDRFGPMAALPHLDPEDVREIAIHLYEGELEIPEWWEEHREEMQGQGRFGKGPGQASGSLLPH